ncbi:MAG: helix-turn-helix domain-containing protein [Candidatus Aminicenantales bacterium]|jgi:hypothetical protein
MGVKERREREEGGRLSAILAAAEHIFSVQGYNQARMDDIAAAAELSKGTLYYYFKSKDEIFFHLMHQEIRKLHEEILRRIEGKTSFLDILEEWIDFYLEYFDKNTIYLRMFLPFMAGFIKFGKACGRRKPIRPEREWRTLRDKLRQAVRREHLPFDIEAMLQFLQTLQIGIGLKLLEGDKAGARASGRFFFKLMKRMMEDQS